MSRSSAAYIILESAADVPGFHSKPPGCKPEPSPSLGHQHQMAEPVTEISGGISGEKE